MCLVIVKESIKGLRASVIASSDNKEYNLVSLFGVTSYEEGISISNLYNKMIDIGIKPSNLYKIVNSLKLLDK